MFLKEITIQNFKCLEDITLSFEMGDRRNRKWTLILGENGTGKSNLLKAIALVTAGSNAIGNLLTDVNSLIRNQTDQCRVGAILMTKAGEERQIAIEITRDDNLSDIVRKNGPALQLIDSAIENAERNYFVVGYGASRRLGEENLINFEGSNNPRYNNIRNLFFSSSPLNPLASWITNLDYQFGAQGIQLIEDTLNDFLPDTRFHSIDKAKKQVLFETADGIVPLSSLSDGYQNMAAWIGDVLFKVTQMFPDYNRPLVARGVLLIDEIDIHLHPKWQRRLLDFISTKLPNFQVIATTHSPLTAQQAGEGELYALQRLANDSKVVLIPFIGSPRNLLVSQLLMTPVFGLETDESLEVEENKKRYDELSAEESTLSDPQRLEFRRVKQKLSQAMPRRTTSMITEDEISMLKRIEEQLNIRDVL